jgi:hypothetical protein
MIIVILSNSPEGTLCPRGVFTAVNLTTSIAYGEHILSILHNQD